MLYHHASCADNNNINAFYGSGAPCLKLSVSEVQRFSIVMPLFATPVLKQVCNTTKHAGNGVHYVSQRTRTLFSTRSQVMSAAQYALVRDTCPVPCASPADIWLKTAPRGGMTFTAQVQGVSNRCTPCSMQVHTRQPELLNRTKSSN